MGTLPIFAQPSPSTPDGDLAIPARPRVRPQHNGNFGGVLGRADSHQAKDKLDNDGWGRLKLSGEIMMRLQLSASTNQRLRLKAGG